MGRCNTLTSRSFNSAKTAKILPFRLFCHRHGFLSASDILRPQIELPEFVAYGASGLSVRVMPSEQLRRLFSRHEITIRHHAGDHPSSIADSDGFATLNFGQ